MDIGAQRTSMMECHTIDVDVIVTWSSGRSEHRPQSRML
jgi:hypothetical protein